MKTENLRGKGRRSREELKKKNQSRASANPATAASPFFLFPIQSWRERKQIEYWALVLSQLMYAVLERQQSVENLCTALSYFPFKLIAIAVSSWQTAQEASGEGGVGRQASVFFLFGENFSAFNCMKNENNSTEAFICIKANNQLRSS